jgi:hypothetical protein
MTSEKTLVFVYNADSGLFNTLTDIAHKVFSPETYECNLCAITFGTFAIRDEWKEFLETLHVPLEFLHRDEFESRYGSKDTSLPAIFVQTAGGLEPFISSVEINSCHSIDDLKKLIEERMQ